MTSRDPIFATLDALIAEGPPDEQDGAAMDRRAERDHVRSLIREAGLAIDTDAVLYRVEHGWGLHDAIHRPLKSNGKLGTKKGKG